RLGEASLVGVASTDTILKLMVQEPGSWTTCVPVGRGNPTKEKGTVPVNCVAFLPVQMRNPTTFVPVLSLSVADPDVVKLEVETTSTVVALAAIGALVVVSPPPRRENPGVIVTWPSGAIGALIVKFVLPPHSAASVAVPVLLRVKTPG